MKISTSDKWIANVVGNNNFKTSSSTEVHKRLKPPKSPTLLNIGNGQTGAKAQLLREI